MIVLPFHLRVRVAALRFAAAILIVLEKALDALSPPFFWIGAFFILWLLQIPAMFGQGVETAAAIVFATGLFTLLYQALPSLRLPARLEPTRRIEEDSNLPHRPLTSLEDSLANTAPGAVTGKLWKLWQVHRPELFAQLRWPRPRPVLSGRDPYALRALCLIGLVLALGVAGPDWRQRLTHGAIPAIPSFLHANPDNVVLWITPPEYTGQPQIVLKGSAHGNNKPVLIPEGSTIKASVHGWFGQPVLEMGKSSLPLGRLEGGNYSLETTITDTNNITIRQMALPRARWAVAYVPDTPPTMAQKGEIEARPDGTFTIPLTLKDDYGVETIAVHIALAPDSTAPPLGTAIDETRNVISPPGTAMDAKPQFNFAWHPWAGMNVVMDIEAKDHKGQTATIKGIRLTLPERQFRLPLAARLMELRKRLLWTPGAAAVNVAYDLETIMAELMMHEGSTRTFLSLRSASSHLFYAPTPENVAKVVAQLWQTALHVEDGNFPSARRNLLNAENALQQALRDPKATPAQIARLTDQVRQAMAAYLNEAYHELQRNMARNGADPRVLTPKNFTNMIDPEALSAILDRMQGQAMSGDRKSAEQMLGQIQKMMDSLDPNSMDGPMPKDMQAMVEQMQKLQDLIKKQKDLLDKTRQQTDAAGQKQTFSDPAEPDEKTLSNLGIKGMPPPPQLTRKGENAPKRGVDSNALMNEQDVIRKSLDGIMQDAADKLGGIPGSMGKAEVDMRNAAQAFGNAQPQAAIPHQEQALKDLADSQKQTGQKLAERMQKMLMLSFGSGKTDPLGHPMRDGNGTQLGGSTIKIPDQAERRKIQDILQQLRKKSGELARPDYELEYYRRLMKQF